MSPAAAAAAAKRAQQPLLKPLDMYIDRVSKSCYKLYGVGKGVGQNRFLLAAHRTRHKKLLRIYSECAATVPHFARWSRWPAVVSCHSH